MTSKTNEPEQNESHSNAVAEADTCPACEKAAIQTLSAVPQPVCIECGYVPESDTSVPDRLDEDRPNGTTEKSWNEYYSVTNSTEQQIASAFGILEEVGDKLLLSDDTRLQAAEVYAEAAKENLSDGRSTRLVVAAAIATGTREKDVPRPSERVARATNVPSRRVKRIIRLFQEELDRGYPSESATAYVSYLCDDGGFDDRIRKQAIHLINEFERQVEQTNNHPVGIAGAAVYLATDGAVTMRQIASATGLTKETIRVRVNDLRGTRE